MEDSRAGFNQIRLADQRGQVAVAVELCKKHLRKYPKDGPAWLRYGMTQVQLARYSEAEKAIQRAIRLCPRKALPIAHVQMGHLLEARGDFTQAALWYRKALKHSSKDATFHIYLGSNAFKRGLLGQSKAHYLRALECPEGCLEEACFNLAGIYLGERNYSEAIKYYEEALRIDPKYRIAKERLEDAKLALLMSKI